MRPCDCRSSQILLITTICDLLALFLIGTAIPRSILIRKRKALKFLIPLVRLLSTLFLPLTKIQSWLCKLMKAEIQDEGPTEEEIMQIVDKGGDSGSIEENEREMIQNIFDFNNLRAEDVMIHRTNVTAIKLGETPEEILKTIMDTGLTRFPVYKEDMDDIIGTLNTRAYLLNLQRQEQRPFRDLLREAYFVPEHVMADVLFRDMQKNKIHMAIVIDEYGGMSGIVTMEDLLEQIVGNIYDEYDPQAENDITQLSDDLWRITGTTPLEDIEEALKISLDDHETERDYDTLGGLIFSRLGTIPRDGSHPEIDVGDVHIRVEQLSEHRVEVALVRKIHPESHENASEL